MSGQVEALHREIALLRADLKLTLQAVLYHFGPSGANKVCTSVLEARATESKP